MLKEIICFPNTLHTDPSQSANTRFRASESYFLVNVESEQ